MRFSCVTLQKSIVQHLEILSLEQLLGYIPRSQVRGAQKAKKLIPGRGPGACNEGACEHLIYIL